MALGKRIQASEERQRTGGMNTRGADNMETVPDSANVKFVGEGRANVVFELTGVENHTGLRGIALTTLFLKRHGDRGPRLNRPHRPTATATKGQVESHVLRRAPEILGRESIPPIRAPRARPAEAHKAAEAPGLLRQAQPAAPPDRARGRPPARLRRPLGV